ncbi:glycine cleavage system aminomethyltransferase GcvT [Cognatiyoonia sp. IB215182]|uniref:glycine cleavage system aminomethyltransferase GcvT n=1 Tax=Cognatiyoonia sp. IB215182 TaxID=3097353 RepID=UPI002A137901|nr:glycine cleavage system aminomethyltransferase GcvT [Cognatiyoonia sp. IB215182]MDX8351179.1 glycine cleavage system aminomethyltransferase GcvT [Cognatiyoonia sp. IB215182]
MSDLLHTPLHDLHRSLGARMVPFAGYEMPVQYSLGVMKEHLHTRTKAGLFDVSHMGQVVVSGESYADAALALESLVPVGILDLPQNRQRYGFITNDQGGIVDDLMLANRGDHVFVVANAACKAADIALMRATLEPDITVTELTDRALLALQGPAAEEVLAKMDPRVRDMAFMDVATLTLNGAVAWVSRSGYTGEDGFEISVPAGDATALAQALLDHPDVEAIGLGARDSLRLEAGLCLHGHDIDAETTPVEATLHWAIQKVRRSGGARAGGFPGADIVLGQLAAGARKRRVGLIPEGRAPMREGVVLFANVDDETPIGVITSGGFGPTVGGPVAMGYVPAAQAEVGTTIFGELRGKRQPLRVAKLPFTPANFKR